MATTAQEEEEEEEDETFILFAAAASTAPPISIFYILSIPAYVCVLILLYFGPSACDLLSLPARILTWKLFHQLSNTFRHVQHLKNICIIIT